MVLRSVAYKELFPIVVAAYLWGPQWSSWQIEYLCDNESMVAVLSSGAFFDAFVSHCWQCEVHFPLRPISVCGRASPVVGTLSHFQFQDSDTWPLKRALLQLQFLWISSKPCLMGAISSSPGAIPCASPHSVTALILVSLMAILVLRLLFSQSVSRP